LIVGFTPGGGYDLNARTLARHLGRHIPGNPNVIVQNMPGAGSLVSINYLANIAPKDGTVLATFSRGVIFEPLMGNKSAQFDPRTLNWIGSPSRETNVLFVRDTTPFQKFSDLQAKEMVVATTGGGADTATFPLLVNLIFKTKLKVVSGYPGANETLLAVERAETDGMAGLSWGYIKASRPSWIEQKKIRVLMQLALNRASDLPDMPTAMEMVQDPADRQLLELFFARLAIAWPLAAPATVPRGRVEALRTAFDETMSDPEYRADAERQLLDVAPVTGSEISELLTRIYATPTAVVERARQINDGPK
ncbi:MAG: Tripartite-type tricarboxylate transporter, receptor component TctC, partial [Hyphomicrobiales bacterium]|nr:Tripartite-type tricarboxylate transporter, receptor component TctC [Hyphomicrobiales bacterium]